MPRFFFHYHTPVTSTYDDLGCDFATLENAYLDAYRSAIDLGAELLKAQVNPASHLLEIADREGRVLMELRFDEIFRRSGLPLAHDRRDLSKQKQLVDQRIADARYLRDALFDACVVARENVAKAHEVLRRARTFDVRSPSSIRCPDIIAH